MTQRVNYDAVASNYNQRFRESSFEDITSALEILAQQVNARRILDLGCGTGRCLQELSKSLPSLLYGLDFSSGMLAQACHLNSMVHLVRASAPFPPYAPSSFDMVFCVHAFQHFSSKFEVVESAYALLRAGGVFAIVNVDPREMDYYVYEYFENTYETDLARFPSVSEQEAMLQQVGFRQVSSPVVQTIESSIEGEAILDSYFLRKDACSELILLSDRAYQDGLGRIRARISEANDRKEKVFFRTYFKNQMCHGFKPA